MVSGIAFLMFFVIWGVAPPVWWYYRRWRLDAPGPPTMFDKVFGFIFVVCVELALFMALGFMHAITHGGIFRWAFWFC